MTGGLSVLETRGNDTKGFHLGRYEERFVTGMRPEIFIVVVNTKPPVNAPDIAPSNDPEAVWPGSTAANRTGDS